MAKNVQPLSSKRTVVLVISLISNISKSKDKFKRLSKKKTFTQKHDLAQLLTKKTLNQSSDNTHGTSNDKSIKPGTYNIPPDKDINSQEYSDFNLVIPSLTKIKNNNLGRSYSSVAQQSSNLSVT